MRIRLHGIIRDPDLALRTLESVAHQTVVPDEIVLATCERLPDTWARHLGLPLTIMRQIHLHDSVLLHRQLLISWCAHHPAGDTDLVFWFLPEGSLVTPRTLEELRAVLSDNPHVYAVVPIVRAACHADDNSELWQDRNLICSAGYDLTSSLIPRCRLIEDSTMPHPVWGAENIGMLIRSSFATHAEELVHLAGLPSPVQNVSMLWLATAKGEAIWIHPGASVWIEHSTTALDRHLARRIRASWTICRWLTCSSELLCKSWWHRLWLMLKTALQCLLDSDLAVVYCRLWIRLLKLWPVRAKRQAELASTNLTYPLWIQAAKYRPKSPSSS